MQKLVRGLHAFQRGYFATHQQLFHQLATAGQHPETLFITCCDSRVVPTLITDAPPGELFIVRNIGNIVPRSDLPGGTSAAIEYAVTVLGVDNIIVCGHTQCGAMQALLHPEAVAELEFVRRWVAQADRVRTTIRDSYSHLSETAQLAAAVQENVLVQLENLRDFPCVKARLEAGTLLVSGWVFDLETGQVFDFDPTRGEFLTLPPPDQQSGAADQAAPSPLAGPR